MRILKSILFVRAKAIFVSSSRGFEQGMDCKVECPVIPKWAILPMSSPGSALGGMRNLAPASPGFFLPQDPGAGFTWCLLFGLASL